MDDKASIGNAAVNIIVWGHLLPKINARLIWFCGALLCVDIFFMVVFAIHEIYVFFDDEKIPLLGTDWNIENDWSYAERFGYLKSVVILASLISIPQLWSRPVYLAFIAIFAFVLVDDALQLHEEFGVHIAAALDLQPSLGLRARDPGELLVWILAGIPLLGAAVFAIVGSAEEDRRNGILLIAGLTVLALFAVVADMAHVVLRMAFQGANDLITLIEDGGEQITLSLICGLAILIHREVRGRKNLDSAPG
jgi:hypothetical protein